MMVLSFMCFAMTSFGVTMPKTLMIKSRPDVLAQVDLP